MEDIDSSHWRLKIELIQSSIVAMLWFGPMRRHMATLLTLGLAVSACCLAGEPGRHNVLTLQGFVTCDGNLPLFVFGAALYQIILSKRSLLWWSLLGVSGLLSTLSNTPVHWTAMIAGLLVLALIATGRLAPLGRIRPLTMLGRIAFPIYVVHFVAGFALIHSLEQYGCPSSVAILAAATMAITMGVLINIVFERPAEKHGPALFSAMGHTMGKGASLVALWARGPVVVVAVD